MTFSFNELFPLQRAWSRCLLLISGVHMLRVNTVRSCSSSMLTREGHTGLLPTKPTFVLYSTRCSSRDSLTPSEQIYYQGSPPYWAEGESFKLAAIVESKLSRMEGTLVIKWGGKTVHFKYTLTNLDVIEMWPFLPVLGSYLPKTCIWTIFCWLDLKIDIKC